MTLKMATKLGYPSAMAIRWTLRAAACAATIMLAACGGSERGPIVVSAIGEAPKLINPNLRPLDAPAAFLIDATAQGLVRFDASGQIEPALAQSWIVSDDGLRYTFRLARLSWSNGDRINAEQVAARLRATTSPASRNPLKALLGTIVEIEAMTDDVLEITVNAPRPNFLQVLAQPEMAIIRNGQGTGPYRAQRQDDGSLLLTLPRSADDEEEGTPPAPAVKIRGERAALAVARFSEGEADLVTGGTLGDFPIARIADQGTALQFDPVDGLLGLAFTGSGGLWANPAARNALNMAIDRPALATLLNIPGLKIRSTLVPDGLDDLPAPTRPDWVDSPQPMRRENAAQAIAALAADGPVTLRVAMPDQPGYRLLFARLRHDWRAIGVDARLVPANAPADLRLIDAVAPVASASWYMRRFSCAASRLCNAEADALLDSARDTPVGAERKARLAAADRLINDLGVFIPIAAPVRWLLVSPRLKGFQPNSFGLRYAGSLVEVR